MEEQKSNSENKKPTKYDGLIFYKDKKTRPIEFGELCIILTRFEIMLKEGPDKYSIQEFIQQEDFRRNLF